MITVGVDTTPLANQSAFRGVGYYTKNLIENLEVYGKNLRIISGSWRDFWPKVDLVHFPYFDFFFLTLPFFERRKTIVTVHDCIPLVLKEHYPAGARGKLKLDIQKFSLRNVSAIITDSESSKKDVVKYLTIPEQKITTIYLAPVPTFRRITSATILRLIAVKYKLPKKFVLYVGDVNYNKNLPGLIEAFASLRRGDFSLVLVGKAFEGENIFEVQEIKELIKKFSLQEKVKILCYIPGEDLVSIYNLATVYCQPSFYEGFGVPLLEAMACGCPVVASKVSSLPEVGGEAAVYVDPYKVEDLAWGIKNLIENKALRAKVIKAGYERVKKFSWEKTARETIKVYSHVTRICSKF